jgi:hypothetical protein
MNTIAAQFRRAGDLTLKLTQLILNDDLRGGIGIKWIATQ